jgi:hypothetical protein
MWQAVETTNCAADKLVLTVRGIFETNTYEVAIPKIGPPMMQHKHVLPVSASNGHRVGNIRGVCFTEFSVIHFAEGDCLMLADLAVYGTGDIEYRDHFYVFSKGHIVELLSDAGDLEAGLRSGKVNTDAAVRGREILIRRQHETFTDWWSEPTRKHGFHQRLVENGKSVRVYCFVMDEDLL